MRAPRIPLTPHERLVIGRKWRVTVDLKMPAVSWSRGDVLEQLKFFVESEVGRPYNMIPLPDRRVVVTYCLAYYELRNGGFNG